MILHNIKRLCAAEGVSLSEVERKADLTPRSIYKWAEHPPAVDKVARVAKALGVTIEELLEDPAEKETA